MDNNDNRYEIYKMLRIFLLQIAMCVFFCECQRNLQDEMRDLKFKVTENSNPDNISVHITSGSSIEVFVGNEGGTLTLESNYVFYIQDHFGNSSLHESKYGQNYSGDFTDESDWYILKKDKDSCKIQINFLKTDDETPREADYYMNGIYLTPASLKIYKNNISE